MSKASTASLQHLLRQLYLAKSASSSIEGALISGGSGGSSLVSGSRSSSAAGGASYSTTARALHAAQDPASSASSSAAAASSSQAGGHHHHAPLPAAASTGDWTATSGGSSGSGTTSSKARSHAHHYHRHNANHHHVSSSSSSLQPQFWMQTPPNGTTSPPLPPFNSTSTSTSSSSNAPPLSYPSSSSATSSSSLTAGPAPSSSQNSDQHYTNPSTSSLDHHHIPSTINDHSQQQQDDKVARSGLTLLPGAYGIPKRVSAGPAPSSNAKGKGKEVMDDNESVQAQIAQMRESLLSVQVGEDAYFVRHDALGVADGVGGWSGRKGADPGLFAARLMHHCSAELELAEQVASSSLSKENEGHSPGRNKSGSHLAFVSSASSTISTDNTSAEEKTKPLSQKQEQADRSDEKHIEVPPEHYNTADTSLPAVASGDPIEVLHRAWDLTLTEFFELELIGSSTALIALLKNDELRLANIGDCSLSIIRGNEYIFRSQEQQHSFNYPFQIGTNSKDTPKKDSQFFNIKIVKDDLVILSSDGLVDNLFDEDILEEVQRYSSTTDAKNGTGRMLLSPERLSKALCSRAKAVSEDQRAVTSPFQQRANEEGIHFVGGKHDDITVLVAVIGDKSESVTA